MKTTLLNEFLNDMSIVDQANEFILHKMTENGYVLYSGEPTPHGYIYTYRDNRDGSKIKGTLEELFNKLNEYEWVNN